MKEARDEMDRRNDLVLVERLVQEGWSQADIEAALSDREERPSRVREALRRLLGGEARKAA